MKKMLLGLLLLGVIFSICLGNTVFLNIELSAIKHGVQKSLPLSQEEAYITLYDNHRRWESLKKYTDLVLPEDKSDAITSLFICTLEEPIDNALKKQLIYELDNIKSMENPEVGSIF